MLNFFTDTTSNVGFYLAECGDEFNFPDDPEIDGSGWIEPDRPVTAPAVITTRPDAATPIGAATPVDSVTLVDDSVTSVDSVTPVDAAPVDAAPVDAAPVDAAPIDAVTPVTSTGPITNDAAPEAPSVLASPPVVAAIQPQAVSNAPAVGSNQVDASGTASAQPVPGGWAPSAHAAISIQTIIDSIPPDGPDSRWYVVTRGVCPGVYDSWYVYIFFIERRLFKFAGPALSPMSSRYPALVTTVVRVAGQR